MAGTSGVVRGAWRAPREGSELVRHLLRRGEPLILVGLALHLAVYAIAHDQPVWLVGLAIAVEIVGVVGLVQPGRNVRPMVRGVLGVALLTIALVAPGSRLVELLPWCTILIVAHPLVFGLRRAWPLVVAITGPLVWATLRTYDAWASEIRIAPALAAAIAAGLITDAMEDSVRAARAAVDRERELRTSIDTAPIGVLAVDLSGRISLVNALVVDFLQLSEPPQHIDEFLHHVHHLDAVAAAEVRAAVSDGRSSRSLLRVVHPQLGARHVRVITATMHDGAGQVVGSALTLQDIEGEIDSRRKLEQFRTLADSTSDIIGLASLGPSGDYLNPAGRDFFGVERITLDEIGEWIPMDQHSLMFEHVFPIVTAGGSWSGELEVFDRHGVRRSTSAVVMGLFDDSGELEAFAAIYRDIEDRKRLESRLAFEAGHDPLTSLPNRQQLFHTLAATLSDQTPVAVLFGDLDGFKLVNDSLGHSVGDELLRCVATRLVDSARGGDLVGRLGGDEFVVVCRGDEVTADSAQHIAQRFIDVVSQPIEIGGREHVVSMSMGIAVSRGVETASELVQQADLAMYDAKRTGRRRVAVFDREMRVRADERLELEADLRTALVRGEFELRYQPIVNTMSGDVLGFEALARWNHPARGRLMPKEFMPVVESAGFARSFGEFVVREATSTTAMMRLVAPRVTMSINVSRAHLLDHRLVDVVADALAQAQVPASALSIEITEEIVMDELASVRPRLDSLRDLGVRFAIDDFGTGYSNLSMLKQFSADYVKIDRSLIVGETELMELVLSLTRQLGFAAIAEGVETTEQLDELRAFGCHHAQGYFFAHPMPFAEAMEYLAGHTHDVQPAEPA